MDVRKYFDSIDKDILYRILSRKIQDYKLLKIIKQIVYSTEGKKGQPIRKLHISNICQYIFKRSRIVKTKKEGKEILEKIRKYLKENLELELNDKTQIFKSSQGVNFCGYKINEYRLKIREKGKRKFKNKVKQLTKQVKARKITCKEAYKYLSGHLGYIKIANTRNLEERLFYNENIN